MKIERIIPYLMDGLAASISSIIAGAMFGLAMWFDGMNAAVFMAAVGAGAFVGIRITRGMVRDQVHMELAEGGK